MTTTIPPAMTSNDETGKKKQQEHAEQDKKQQLFDKYNKLIDELYSFRDTYYMIHSESKSSSDRINDLNVRLAKLSAELESIGEDQFPSKASHLILIGRAYNVLPELDPKALDALTRAIKLDSKSIDAWNYLGECYWKQRNFEMCRNCFERSLNIQPNVLSLRGMAMVTRQLINVPANKEQLQQTNTDTQSKQSQPMRVKTLLDESIRYGKEAVKLDAQDSMNWYILANCYMAKFFSPFGNNGGSGGENAQATATGLLKQAITAYSLALRDKNSVASMHSDLHFNKSMLSMYEENWSDVLYSLTRAHQLDPHWSEVKENLEGTLDYLAQISEMTAQKGKLKAKKFASLVESISKSDLGPYGDETTNSIPLTKCTLSELSTGLNSNKVLVGKVICGLPTTKADNLLCFTCCIADVNGDCAALTIYNLASGSGVIIGNSVAIPEPWFEQVNVKHQLANSLCLSIMSSNQQLAQCSTKHEDGSVSVEFKFNSVRVENPAVLVVNGRKWTKEKVSSAFFVPKILSD